MIPLLWATPSRAAQKPPWQWTTAERLAARFDPELSRGRLEAAARRGEGPLAAPEAEASVIEGSRNPELLLPWELFQDLLHRGYSPLPEAREAYRAEVLAKARSLGFGEDFWDTLESLAPGLLQSLGEQRALLQDLSSLSEAEREKARGAIHTLQAGECRRRADALRAARDAFGAPRFDRLLYEAVAPSVTLQRTGEDNPQRLKFVEGGCQ